MKILPLGRQTFQDIIEHNCVYVDKTAFIYRMITEGKVYFLSRPRRFGKSTLTTTLKAVFEGKKELFKGLYIEDKIDWQPRPVLLFHFADMSYKSQDLQSCLVDEIKLLAAEYEVNLKATKPGMALRELIVALSKTSGQKVALLIDEYDKPIIDFMDDIPQAKRNRDTLRDFFGVVKGLDAHLEFFFLTGVSRFSKVSVFSDLNHLTDMTLNPKYNTICGYTQTEILEYFSEYLEAMANNLGIPINELLEKVTEWYNGYSWDGNTRVYNPFGFMQFLEHGKFQGFWFESGTPTMLIKMLNKDIEFDLQNVKASTNDFSNYSLDNIQTVPLLFQTGYLTILEMEDSDLTLSYPNREVKEAFTQILLKELTARDTLAGISKKLANSIHSKDLKTFFETIHALFANIPSQLFQPDSERFYHAILHNTLTLLGLDIRCEVSSALGRLDAAIETADTVYVMEFKLNRTPPIAIRQIRDNGYAEPFRLGSKKVVLVGIQLSGKKRGIATWAQEDFLKNPA